MPNIIVIDPSNKTVRNYDAPDDLNTCARDIIGVDSLDHGTVAILPDHSRLMIIVYGEGLIGGPHTKDQYFVLNHQLYNGPAVIYAADHTGETIDVSKNLALHLDDGSCTHLHWCSSAEVAERLIISGGCDRPQTTVNGKVIWSWSPRTDYKNWEVTIKEEIKKH